MNDKLIPVEQNASLEHELEFVSTGFDITIKVEQESDCDEEEPLNEKLEPLEHVLVKYGGEEAVECDRSVGDLESKPQDQTNHTLFRVSQELKKEEEAGCNSEDATRITTSSNQQQTDPCVHNKTNRTNYSQRRESKSKIQGNHYSEKSFKCNNCLYKSNSKGNLIVHMRTHTREKPFACSQCPYRAAQRGDISKHMATHTNEKPFCCGECSYRAARQDNLVAHMKTHKNEKPFACSQCPYRAAHHPLLVRHIRTHTNEKPYACSQCSYKAAQRGTLVTHMRTHTKEKPFACSQCSYRAAHRGHLGKHIRTHR